MYKWLDLIYIKHLKLPLYLKHKSGRNHTSFRRSLEASPLLRRLSWCWPVWEILRALGIPGRRCHLWPKWQMRIFCRAKDKSRVSIRFPGDESMYRKVHTGPKFAVFLASNTVGSHEPLRSSLICNGVPSTLRTAESAEAPQQEPFFPQQLCICQMSI